MRQEDMMLVFKWSWELGRKRPTWENRIGRSDQVTHTTQYIFLLSFNDSPWDSDGWMRHSFGSTCEGVKGEKKKGPSPQKRFEQFPMSPTYLLPYNRL